MEATEVLNLATGEVIVYTLPPEGAVKVAFLQFTMKDFNTWNYDKRDVPLVHGKRTVICGDFGALIK